jgi:hypothetical protein
MTKTATYKTANIGGTGDEAEFEKAFAGIAYSTIRNKAPRLLDSLVGFQLIERNEDNSKAIGAFGFKLGKQWLMAPIFFLNGEVKGHEILYVKNTDTCVPLKEDWVNSLISQTPYEVGEQSGAQQIGDLGGSKPMIRSLAIPPSNMYGKWASDAAWAREFLPMFAAIKTKQANSLYASAPQVKLAYDQIVEDPLGAAVAEVGGDFDLNKLLSQDVQLFKAAHDAAESMPLIKAAFQQFYGKDCFERWAGQALQNFRTEQANILPAASVKIAKDKPLSASLIEDPVFVPEDHPVKSGAVQIYYSHAIVGGTATLEADEKSKLVREGKLIKDKRKSSQISKILKQKTHFQLNNPGDTGLYDILEADGTTDKMLVVVHGIGNPNGRIVTLIRLDGSDRKSRMSTYLSNVYAEKQYDKSDWDKWFKKLPKANSFSEGAEYIVVHEDGSATAPFRVHDKLNDEEYRVSFSSCCVDCDGLEDTRALPFERLNAKHNKPTPYEHQILRIVPEGGSAKKLRQTETYLQVTASCRALKLTEGYDDSPMFSLIDSERKEPTTGKPIRTGNSNDIHRLIFTKTAGISVWTDQNEILVKSATGTDRYHRSNVVWDLIRDHGFSEADAELIAKTASDRPEAYRVQYAPGFGTEKDALNMRQDPRFTDLVAEFEDMNPRTTEMVSPRHSANFKPNYEMNRPVPELMAANQDLSNWNIWQNYLAEDFNRVKSLAQVATERGQKEIFDVSMFTGLIKAVSKDTLVERYLPSLVRALDSLGRLLLSFYWHSAEFADRYGKNDLPELEDSLRNAFESLGSVTLFLKEKTIESPLQKGDVDLDDAARV